MVFKRKDSMLFIRKMIRKIIFELVMLLCIGFAAALEAEVIDEELNIINDQGIEEIITSSKVEGKIILKITEEADFDEANNRLENPESCTLYIFGEGQGDVWLSHEKCEKLNDDSLRFLNGFEIESDPDARLQELVRRVVNLLDKKAGKKPEIKFLKIELEKNDEGKEFKGLIGMYGNSIDVTIYYPTKYDSSELTYTSNERDGSIELEDSGCTIEYKLREHDEEEVELGGKKREIKRTRGKLYLWDEKEKKPDSGILLSYSRTKGSLSFDMTDILEVTMKCKRYEETKTKDILVSYKPVVFLVPGLWANPKNYEFLPIYQKRYGQHFFVFDYFATTVEKIEENADLLSKFIDQKIQEVEKKELVKVGKVGIFGHSVGGWILLQATTNENTARVIGRGVPLGGPFLGTSQVDLIYESCPYDRLNEIDPGCMDYNHMVIIMRLVFPMLPEAFGTIGPATVQLRSESDFIKEGEKKKLGAERITVVAGTKAMAPWWLTKVPKIRTAIALTEWAFNKGTGVPDSMKETFHELVLSLVEKGTDGSVSIDSALWNKYIQQRLIHPNYIRRRIHSTHSGLIRDDSAQSLTIRELEEVLYTFASVGSPVNIYVYDKEGNLVGLKEGELKEEIPNAEFFIDEDNEAQSIIIDDDKDYTFVIEAIDNGNFSFSVNQRQEDKELSIYYDNITITDKTKASFELARDSDEYILKVDLDGDGIIDKELEPDFLQIVDIEPEEMDYVRSGKIETDFEKPKSKIWIWVLSLIVIIVISLVLFMRKRQYPSQSI